MEASGFIAQMYLWAETHEKNADVLDSVDHWTHEYNNISHHEGLHFLTVLFHEVLLTDLN